jgi:hypothetical protein
MLPIKSLVTQWEVGMAAMWAAHPSQPTIHHPHPSGDTFASVIHSEMDLAQDRSMLKGQLSHLKILC